MRTANPYLNFPGNAEEAFQFYRSVMGTEIAALIRFKDTAEGAKLSAADQQKIMHIALPLGNGNMLMATDALESMGHKLATGNNFYILLSAESREEADKLYHGLSEGGSIESPLQDVFWGDYFGMFKDKYGVQWMVSYDKNYRK